MRFVSKITSTTYKPERLSKFFHKTETFLYFFYYVDLRYYSAVPSPGFILSLAQRNIRIEKIFHAS